MMTSRNANGNGVLSEKTRVPITFLIVVAGLLLTAAGSFWGVSATLGQHVTNIDIHHSTEALDKTYMRRDLSDQRYQQLCIALDKVQVNQDNVQDMLVQLGAKRPRD